jgi:hypothetical protein
VLDSRRVNGEFNTFVLPYHPFDVPAVIRQPSTQFTLFLLALGPKAAPTRRCSKPVAGWT